MNLRISVLASLLVCGGAYAAQPLTSTGISPADSEGVVGAEPVDTDAVGRRVYCLQGTGY